jgi:REP element-mobilizing transposase RayT
VLNSVFFELFLFILTFEEVVSLARSARAFSESGMYHILLRSKNKIFSSESDYIKFISDMNDCFLKYGGLLGYALMPNRVHMIILDKNGKLSTIIRIITTKYSRYKKESVFYDRFKCEPIRTDEELAEVLDFIYKNPLYLKQARIAGADIECVRDEEELNKRLSHSRGGDFHMFMDDYKSMSKKEIKQFIKLLTGIEADKIKNLDFEKRRECIEKLKRDNWISNRRLADILGICRNCFTYKSVDEKETDKLHDVAVNDSRDRLDVWLL